MNKYLHTAILNMIRRNSSFIYKSLVSTIICPDSFVRKLTTNSRIKREFALV